jgi:AcrR family transcriptional regulator
LASLKKQVVIDKASELFVRHGFYPVGVDWIIEASGVARMTMYRNFNGKDDLVRAVLQQRHERTIEDITSRLTDSETVEGKLKIVFDWYAEWFLSAEFSGCLFYRALIDFPDKPEIRNVAIEHKLELNRIISTVLQGTYPEERVRSLAKTIIMLLDGATESAVAKNETCLILEAWSAAKVLLSAAQY